MSYPIAIFVSVMLACFAVMIHFEAMTLISKHIHRMIAPRKQLLFTMLGLLFAHMIEIWLFGGFYALLSIWPELGSLSSPDDVWGWFDPVYYSAMVYTTVGFGDILPHGALRMVTATEALVGLSLITWSASFTFIQMQRVWR